MLTPLGKKIFATLVLTALFVFGVHHLNEAAAQRAYQDWVVKEEAAQTRAMTQRTRSETAEGQRLTFSL